MQVSSVRMANTSFKGHEEMQSFARKLARDDKDYQLTEMAKDAFSTEINWSLDYASISAEDEKKVNKFIGEAQKSQNPRLAFLLLNDLRSAFRRTKGYSLGVSNDIKGAMINIARESDQVKNSDIIDCLVLNKHSDKLNIQV